VLRAATTTLFAVVALVAWALASPVGSAPDDDYHIVSIWCGRGDADGFCQPSDVPGERKVPRQFLDAPCFAFDPAKSAACQPAFVADPELVSTNRGNFDGDYPPVYYWTMNWFAGRHLVQSVLLMRLVNIFVAVAMVTAVAVLSPPGVRRAVVAAASLTVVPLGLFMLTSVNPSSWALTSAFTFTFALVGYLVTSGRRRRVLAGMAALSLLIGAGARGDAGLYAAFGAVLAVLVAWRSGVRKDLVVPGVLALAGLVTFLSVGQSDNANLDPGSRPSVSDMVWTMFDIPSLWTGSMGNWGLGWLDTYASPVVWIASWSVLVGGVFAALPSKDRRHQLALVALGAAVWIVPGYTQIRSGYPVGGWVQPRYILPLVAMLVGVAFLRTTGGVRWTKVQWLLAVVALTVANSVGLFNTMRRFTTGSDVGGLNLGNSTEWWWAMPVGPMAVWFVGSVAFGVAITGLLGTLKQAVEPSAAPVQLAAVQTADPAPTADPGHGEPGHDKPGHDEPGRDEPAPEVDRDPPTEPVPSDSRTTSSSDA